MFSRFVLISLFVTCKFFITSEVPVTWFSCTTSFRYCYTYILFMWLGKLRCLKSQSTVVNDLRIRPQMAKFILTKWPHGSSLHTYRVPPGPLDQPWCTPIVSYSNRYTPTPELLGSLLLFWQAIFKLPWLQCYLMYLNGWWCKLPPTNRAK